MHQQQRQPPIKGAWIDVGTDGRLNVPNQPIIGYIEGDGTGPDIWRASQPVLDAAVHLAYSGQRQLHWWELLAGDKARQLNNAEQSGLPQATLDALRRCHVGIKGPLATPVGHGQRSLNVALRQELDLYVCLRPVRYFSGVPAPVKHPEQLDVVIFRENTEDVYMGLEWEAYSEDAQKLLTILNQQFLTSSGKQLRQDTALGLKPMSESGCKRLIRRALQYAIKHHKPSVTLVHKGNIMKYTEGAFNRWGYELAKAEFSAQVINEDDAIANYGSSEKVPPDKVVLKDRIADAMFQQILLRPSEYSVIATPNLNGDYLSDACAAQVGGLGLAPGANIGDEVALFEATHGTAPKYANTDKVNPGSVILSGAMLLHHLGWTEAAILIEQGLAATIAAKTVTYDLHRQMSEATLVSCSRFGAHIVAAMESKS